MIIIDKKSSCCGCTACEAICPKKCITMVADSDGCLYPEVNTETCIDCHLCEKVCPIINRKEEKPFEQHAFLVQHKDDDILLDSTSGGAFTAIAQWVLSKDGIVYGAAYDENLNVIHCSIDNEKDLWRFRNSKYVQSTKTGVFREIKKNLDTGKLVLFSGTPCENEGLLSFLSKDYNNLLTLDIMCHACPSPLVFNKYIEMQINKNGKDILNARFREKRYGYKYSTMSLFWKSGKQYHEGIDTDVMLRAFFSNMSPRPSCFSCAFKKRYRRVDFTLWDCFNVKKFYKPFDNDKGVTRILAHTQKSLRILEQLNNCHIVEIDVEKAVEGVKEMYYSEPENPKREAFIKDLNRMSPEECFDKYFPNTIRHKVEKYVRIATVRLGIYQFMKDTFKTAFLKFFNR